LSAYVARNHRDWPDFVQAITFAYNITQHSVTKMAPYELVFGRRPRLPLDNLLGRNELIDPRRPLSTSITGETYKVMKRLIQETQEANKKRLDRRLAECTFQVGDKVLLERSERVRGGSHKLSNVYVGPFTIKSKLGDLSFEISAEDPNSRSFVVHPHMLKRFVQRDGEVADDIIEPGFVPRENVEAEAESDDTASCSEGEEIFDPFIPPPLLSPHATRPEDCDSGAQQAPVAPQEAPTASGDQA